MLSGKVVKDPKGLGRVCTVQLDQGFRSMFINSTKAEEVRVSPRYWIPEGGNLAFILLFPVAYLLAKGYQLNKYCGWGLCKRDSDDEVLEGGEMKQVDIMPEQEQAEPDKRRVSCARRVRVKFMELYTAPWCCLCGRSVKQVMLFAFHFYDLFTDIQYLVTIPLFEIGMFWGMIASLILPLLLCYWVMSDTKESGLICGSLVLSVAVMYLGAAPLVLTDVEDPDDQDDVDRIKALQDIVFGILQDYPQFFIQGLNTLMIG